MSTWISVDDHLPKIGETVIVLEDDYVDAQEGYIQRLFDSKTYKPQRVSPATLRSIDREGYALFQDGITASGHALKDHRNVTYWMPLPVVPVELVKPVRDYE